MPSATGTPNLRDVNSETKFPRGSEWRRWDLHVHTPGTALSDRFNGNWDAFIGAIEANDSVKVIGVTDYVSIENYSRMKKLKEEGRFANINMLIPNIEFRLSPQTDKGHALNLHLLVSPDDPNHENRINQALESLTLSFDGEIYRCNRDGLTRLGRAYEPQIQDDESAYKEGVNQFKIHFSQFEAWWESQTWLSKNALTIVSGGNDGIGGLSFSDGWGATRIIVSAFSHIIFSSNTTNRNFWLGKTDNPQHYETLQKCRGPKPCIHGSDAHDLDKLFEPDQKRYCWIKADPTFEGLRQILYEPEDRVFIGEKAPTQYMDANIIESIEIVRAKDSGWFETIQIPVNPGLVTIIGPRGSGKSAFAELIAFAGGSWQEDTRQTFIERAGTHIYDTEIKINWANGKHTSAVLGQDMENDITVRYLSQRFVERLCSEDHNGGALVREIERVIFAYTPVEERLNTSSFTQLLERHTSSLRGEKARQKNELERLIDEMLRLRSRQNELPDKKATVTKMETDITTLNSEISTLAIGDDAIFTAELAEHQQNLATLRRKVATIKEQVLKIDAIEAQIERFEDYAKDYFTEIQPLLQAVGISEVQYVKFQPKLGTDVKTLTTKRKSELHMQETELNGIGPHSPNTIAEAVAKLANIQGKISTNQAVREKIQLLQTQLTNLQTSLFQKNLEIQTIEVEEAALLSQTREQIKQKYLQAFDILQREEEILERLYQPVREHLSSSDKTQQPLDFSIRQHVELDTWLIRFTDMLDARRTSAYPFELEEFRQFSIETLLPAWTSGDTNQISKAFDKLTEKLQVELKSASDYLRPTISEATLLRWLYDIEHTSLNYGLRYNGTDLEKLSPGTKGIVLLILYLIMDTEDKRPLIVDQPEENLDNESIYDLLVPHFRTAKLQRQIFLVTHNPNLVVNTDAEQVIIANCDKTGNLPLISYTSGALEDSATDGTRDRLCAILEGGKDAFQRRELRYNIFD